MPINSTTISDRDIVVYNLTLLNREIQERKYQVFNEGGKYEDLDNDPRIRELKYALIKWWDSRGSTIADWREAATEAEIAKVIAWHAERNHARKLLHYDFCELENNTVRRALSIFVQSIPSDLLSDIECEGIEADLHKIIDQDWAANQSVGHETIAYAFKRGFTLIRNRRLAKKSEAAQ